MGIYTSSRYFAEAHDYAAEIPANEAYGVAFGCAHVLVDRVDNDRALFESTIRSDIAEVISIREGYEVFNEGVFGDIIKKIVEMFKKLLGKIKGIFNAFIAKLAGHFKNGKDLVKKYDKQIYKYSGTWKKFKVPGIRKPRTGKTDIKGALEAVFVNKNFNECSRYTLDSSNFSGGVTAENYKTKKEFYNADLGSIETIEQVNKSEVDDLKDELLKVYIGDGLKISDYKDMGTEIKDHLYDDEEKFDGDDENVSASYFSAAWIKGVLNDDKWLSDVKKTNEKLEKAINYIIDALIKTNDNLSKFRGENEKDGGKAFADVQMKFTTGPASGKFDKNTTVSKINGQEFTKDGDDYNKDKAQAVQDAIHAMQKIASNEQTVISDVTSKYVENVNFAIAQARKMYSAAAAYTATMHNESYEYVQAVAECAEEQFYSNMESLG